MKDQIVENILALLLSGVDTREELLVETSQHQKNIQDFSPLSKQEFELMFTKIVGLG